MCIQSYLRLSVLLGLSVALVSAKEFTVDWKNGGPIDSIEVNIGDTVVFQYNQGSHDVVQVEKFTCKEDNINSGTTVAGFDTSSYTFEAKEVGRTTFLCSVPGHCLSGQIIDIIVLSGKPGERFPPTWATFFLPHVGSLLYFFAVP